MMLQEIDTAESSESLEFTPQECPHCGSAKTGLTTIRSAIWNHDKLVVIDGIPAVVCEDCGERFFDDETATILDLMQGDGFPAEKAITELRVPVFAFGSPRFASARLEDDE